MLYGTGKKFKDYDDIKAIKKEVDKFYIPRIQEMYRILKITGSIYLQMDYRIEHWIRYIMDDIFSYDNFMNNIVWSKGNEQNNAKNNFAFRYDNILFYKKSNKNIFNMQYIPFDNKNANRYNKEDENGKYALVFDKKQDTYYKCYLKDEIPLNNIWVDIHSAKSRRYDTEKPNRLLERIIKSSSNEGDIVADFFMGSGTTGEVALELGRKFIGCDIGEKACQITKERLDRMVK